VGYINKPLSSRPDTVKYSCAVYIIYLPTLYIYMPISTERYIDILSRFDGYEFRFFGNARAYIICNIMCADEKKIYETRKKTNKKKVCRTSTYPSLYYLYYVCVYFIHLRLLLIMRCLQLRRLLTIKRVVYLYPIIISSYHELYA